MPNKPQTVPAIIMMGAAILTVMTLASCVVRIAIHNTVSEVFLYSVEKLLMGLTITLILYTPATFWSLYRILNNGK